MNANMQLTISSFRQLFTDKIVFADISLTFSKIPDISLTAVKFSDISGFPDKWSPCVKFLINYHLRSYTMHDPYKSYSLKQTRRVITLTISEFY